MSLESKKLYYWEVLYQEIDSDRRMRLFALENHILSIAGKAADEGGFGQQYLFKQGLTWIITNCSIEMEELPQAGDRLVFETWIESNAHMLSVRDYRIYKVIDDKQQEIGKAKTTWAILDLEKREIVNIFDQPVFQNIVDGEPIDMPRPSRMVPFDDNPSGAQSTPTPIFLSSSTPINYSSVDYNNHCNSCKYPEFMLDLYKPDWLASSFRFDIRYAQEMRLGQTITTECQYVDNLVRFQQKNESGVIVCSSQIVRLKKK